MLCVVCGRIDGVFLVSYLAMYGLILHEQNYNIGRFLIIYSQD